MVQIDRALFVHIPKTGGTFIRKQLLKNNGIEFSYAHDIPQHNIRKIKKNKLIPFCIIRHPLELLYSLWKHWSGDSSCRINNLNQELYWQWDKKEYGTILAQAIKEGDINATVYNFLTMYPGFFTSIYEKYTKHCKYIGRYENLNADLANILFNINGKVQENLLIDIFDKNRVNESLGEEGLLDKRLAIKFIANESACFLHNYVYLPEFVMQ